MISLHLAEAGCSGYFNVNIAKNDTMACNYYGIIS